MILSAETLRRLKPVQPFCERSLHRGMSFGLSLAGYDVRVQVDDRHYSNTLPPVEWRSNGVRGFAMRPGATVLVSTVEQFSMPIDVVGVVHNKSTWLRQGLAVPSAVLEPGWRGFLTLALSNFSTGLVSVFDGDPIAQIVFHKMDSEDGPGYSGKYQGQGPEPTPTRSE